MSVIFHIIYIFSLLYGDTLNEDLLIQDKSCFLRASPESNITLQRVNRPFQCPIEKLINYVLPFTLFHYFINIEYVGIKVISFLDLNISTFTMKFLFLYNNKCFSLPRLFIYTFYLICNVLNFIERDVCISGKLKKKCFKN